ncbi:hypothetical protein AnigIFM63309_005125 [Aspergillus niger]|nr:hypothetical protein AnigIFM63309_005125 [Aspergillus niger]
MLLHPIPSPAVLEPGKDQVQSYIAEMNPKILPPPARKATNPLELLHTFYKISEICCGVSRAARLSAAARCALDANLGVKPPQRDTVFLLHFDPHDENIRWFRACTVAYCAQVRDFNRPSQGPGQAHSPAAG